MGEEAVGGHVAQPAAERAGPSPLKPGQFADEDGHDVLGDILGLVTEAGVAKQPAADERPVQVVETPPRRLVGPSAQPLQQAG